VTRKDPASSGMLVHVGRLTPKGFQAIQIWESKEQQERFDAEVVQPVMTQFSGAQPSPTESAREEFPAARPDRPRHAGRRLTAFHWLVSSCLPCGPTPCRHPHRLGVGPLARCYLRYR
jgi:hypothetical protein